jgi:hypothetical protein
MYLAFIVLGMLTIAQSVVLTFALRYSDDQDKELYRYKRAAQELYDAAFYCLPELPIVEELSDWHDAMCDGEEVRSGEDMAEYLRTMYQYTTARHGVPP